MHAVMEELIKLHEVGCTFKARQGFMRLKSYTALRDISFSVNRGETLGVIGSNGAGKSTLLKLLGGIIRPDTGTISFKKDISISLLNLQMGFAAELSGRTNALISSMLMGFSRKEAEERLDKIIAFAELEDWADSAIKTYSTGMKARLGFAVAFEMTPDVLLIDEVLGVGDKQFQKKSATVMKEKIASDKFASVFVSHSIPTVQELCTRVLWLDKGEIKAIGPTDEVVKKFNAAD